ncbi:D-alanyl-D-alanine carboxypeptidase family protein [Streptomyces sp. NRRL F-5126]|uniref:D-alanyl-D-alanine carboxypeptidase family protein n=1 Tax=Streptomyces sp. NRRL F-5126 TaxID=1463857 RepID=UPI000A951C7F|nr:D-alanyl-D-alanine carboxypeptidase [Streptomyces sp. NRRL F-5126]
MSAAKKTAVTVASTAVLSLLAAAPAWASGGADASDAPKPPAHMSSVGGARLGVSGTQVSLAGGAPALPKKLTGRSWIVSDAESGDVLAAHNAHWRLPPASTLKMLFADTLLPKLPSDEQHKVAASDLKGMGAGSSLVGVEANQTYSVHDLWLGVFLKSGNDAVHVLAAMNGGVPRTVQQMQQHADDLQALDTHVVSPDGYDMPGQVSSAYDLSLFARSGLQNKDFREYCSTATAQFPGAAKKGKKRPSFQIQNTDRLLSGTHGMTPYPGIAGVKNGYTTNAGNTYTGVAQRGSHVILVTVMNPSATEPNAVYKEAASLLDWGFAADGKVTPVGKLVPPKSLADTKQAGSSSSPSTGKAAATAPAEATAAHSSSGVGTTSLAIIGGVLVVLAAGGFFVNRRWPRRPQP